MTYNFEMGYTRPVFDAPVSGPTHSGPGLAPGKTGNAHDQGHGIEAFRIKYLQLGATGEGWCQWSTSCGAFRINHALGRLNVLLLRGQMLCSFALLFAGLLPPTSLSAPAAS